MLRYIAIGYFAGIVVHSDCVMGYCLAIIRFQISVLHHSVRIECAVVRMGELYLITGLEQKTRGPGTGTASHGVQAFIGLLLGGWHFVHRFLVLHSK